MDEQQFLINQLAIENANLRLDLHRAQYQILELQEKLKENEVDKNE